MKVSSVELDGLRLIELAVHGDARGFFIERFQQARFRDAGQPHDATGSNPVDAHPLVQQECRRTLHERQHRHESATTKQTEPIDRVHVDNIVEEPVAGRVQQVARADLRDPVTVSAQPIAQNGVFSRRAHDAKRIKNGGGPSLRPSPHPANADGGCAGQAHGESVEQQRVVET